MGEFGECIRGWGEGSSVLGKIKFNEMETEKYSRIIFDMMTGLDGRHFKSLFCGEFMVVGKNISRSRK